MIVGDFNARPDGPSMVFVPPTWIDTYAVANDSQPAMTCCLDKGGFDGSTRVRKRVDYVFVRLQRDEPAAILSSRIVLNAPFDDGLWPLDHFGVLSEIEL